LRFFSFFFIWVFPFSVLAAGATNASPNGLSYYEILGVSKDATQQELRDARNAKAKQYHGDLNQNPAARQWMTAVNEAYGTLSDAKNRAIYDFKLNKDAAPSPEKNRTPQPRELHESLVQMFSSQRPLSPALLADAQMFLVQNLGNPAKMASARQKQLFYQDLRALILIATTRSPFLHSDTILAIEVDLLLRFRDVAGENILDELYVDWERRIRLGYPDEPALLHLPVWMEILEIVEAKYGRRVPKPGVQCGRYLDIKS
jgi:hypothetical protein